MHAHLRERRAGKTHAISDLARIRMLRTLANCEFQNRKCQRAANYSRANGGSSRCGAGAPCGGLEMMAMGGLSLELKNFVSQPRKLVCYNGQGRKKNERFFFLSHLDREPAEVTWRRKLSDRKGKSMPLRDVHDGTRLPSARQIFRQMDADNSGTLNQQEVAELYRITMGEKLGKKRLQEAMRVMDTDGSGQVSCEEFAHWWDQTGRELDQARDRAFALELGAPWEPPLTKRLVAPDIRTKNMWLEACCALLGKSLARPDPEEAEPERAPRLELSLPYDLQPVVPMLEPKPEHVSIPEPEPEPEPQREHRPVASSRPQELPQSKWAQKWSVQHQRWYWTHEGTGQASWLKEAEMTREETELYNHQRHSQSFSHNRGPITDPATAFTKVLADSSGAFSPSLMSWGSARISRATPIGRHDRPRFIGWATWAQDALADSDAEQGVKMDRAARLQHPGTRAATYEEYTRGRIVGLPETYAPQCHDPRGPQYFPERSMLYGWLVLKGPGNEVRPVSPQTTCAAYGRKQLSIRFSVPGRSF